MIIFTIVKKIAATILYLMLSAICMAFSIIEFIGIRVASIILNLLLICAFLALITADWKNLVVFGILIGTVVVILAMECFTRLYIGDWRDGLKSHLFF